MSEHNTIFQSMHHVCIVVADIEQSVAYYCSLGISPWHDYPPLDQYTQLEVPDRSTFLAMKYKYANITNVQIQLCQPAPGNSPQRRFLDERGGGVFHLGFSVPNCDQAEAAAHGLGLQTLMKGRREDRSGFTYFQTADRGAGVTLEIRASQKP